MRDLKALTGNAFDVSTSKLLSRRKANLVHHYIDAVPFLSD